MLALAESNVLPSPDFYDVTWATLLEFVRAVHAMRHTDFSFEQLFQVRWSLANDNSRLFLRDDATRRTLCHHLMLLPELWSSSVVVGGDELGNGKTRGEGVCKPSGRD